ncbi:hypothetical protein IE81DRAFT_26257 [Ceraceosorus guamensis]|uniref:Uncharacterized protein n=1 Tax=Ceraceosorus guamensis TaxID=1522189 RepID=A0A316VSQ3_9BASI|nr:hypothetical protein IE81DRAFT_26257 [Ceraceosorus guamensis]PWN39443.1 hypothetical protein IE81DRAFT_26257 [Ceraceosorus guamensis]
MNDQTVSACTIVPFTSSPFLARSSRSVNTMVDAASTTKLAAEQQQQQQQQQTSLSRASTSQTMLRLMRDNEAALKALLVHSGKVLRIRSDTSMSLQNSTQVQSSAPLEAMIVDSQNAMFGEEQAEAKTAASRSTHTVMEELLKSVKEDVASTPGMVEVLHNAESLSRGCNALAAWLSYAQTLLLSELARAQVREAQEALEQARAAEAARLEQVAAAEQAAKEVAEERERTEKEAADKMAKDASTAAAAGDTVAIESRKGDSATETHNDDEDDDDDVPLAAASKAPVTGATRAPTIDMNAEQPIDLTMSPSGSPEISKAEASSTANVPPISSAVASSGTDPASLLASLTGIAANPAFASLSETANSSGSSTSLPLPTSDANEASSDFNLWDMDLSSLDMTQLSRLAAGPTAKELTGANESGLDLSKLDAPTDPANKDNLPPDTTAAGGDASVSNAISTDFSFLGNIAPDSAGSMGAFENGSLDMGDGTGMGMDLSNLDFDFGEFQKQFDSTNEGGAEDGG